MIKLWDTNRFRLNIEACILRNSLSENAFRQSQALLYTETQILRYIHKYIHRYIDTQT